MRERDGGMEGVRGKEKEQQVLFKSKDIGLDVSNIAACLAWQGFEQHTFAQDKCVSRAI